MVFIFALPLFFTMYFEMEELCGPLSSDILLSFDCTWQDGRDIFLHSGTVNFKGATNHTEYIRTVC